MRLLEPGLWDPSVVCLSVVLMREYFEEHASDQISGDCFRRVPSDLDTVLQLARVA